MGWPAALATIGASLIGRSGSKSGGKSIDINPILGQLINGNLPRSTITRTNGIIDGAIANEQQLRQALGYASNQFNRAENALAPLMQHGDRGIDMLSQLAQQVADGTFYNADDPAYKFQLEQGQRALNTTANAQGLYGSGGRAKELLEYGQGLASTFKTQELNNRLSTIAPLANMGIGARQDISNLRSSLGGLGADIFSRIGAVQNARHVGAGESQYGGLLDQINAFNAHESIRNGIRATSLGAAQNARNNAADNASAIGKGIGSILDALRNNNKKT